MIEEFEADQAKLKHQIHILEQKKAIPLNLIEEKIVYEIRELTSKEVEKSKQILENAN